MPKHWNHVRVDQISEIIRGVSYKKEISSGSSLENYVPILRATNIQEDKLILDTDLVFIPKKNIKQDQYLVIGDVVVCISSGSKNLVGKSAQLENNWIGSFGTFCATIRFNSQVNKKFGGFFFNSPIYSEKIKEKSSGININNIRLGHLGEISFPLPPIFEQKRIVSKIEELFTQLDAAEAALKRAKINLKRYKQSLLQAAVTGELTREWRQTHKDELEHASSLLEKIKAEQRAKWEADIRGKGKDPTIVIYVKPKASDDSILPELPDGWCWIKVTQITKSMKNGIYKPAEYYSDDGVACLRMYNIEDGRIVWKNIKRMKLTVEELNEYSLVEDDILVNRVNSRELVGKSAVIPSFLEECVFESKNIRLRIDKDFIISKYLNIWFLHNSRKYFNFNAQQVVGMASINQNQLGAMDVPLPSIEEQNQIIQIFEDLNDLIIQTEKSLSINLRHIQKLRQSILQKAFTGKLIQPQTEELE